MNVLDSQERRGWFLSRHEGMQCAILDESKEHPPTEALGRWPRVSGRSVMSSRSEVCLRSTGDGSVNNGMFLSALTMAQYARHKKFKCPILFGISSNDLTFAQAEPPRICV